MITSKGEPIFAHVNMHGFRWKFMAPSSSRAGNSVMNIAERSSLKILPSPNTTNLPQYIQIYWVGDNRKMVSMSKSPHISDQLGTENAYSVVNTIMFDLSPWYEFWFATGLGFSRPKPVFPVQNGIKRDKPVFPSFSRPKLGKTVQNWEKLWRTIFQEGKSYLKCAKLSKAG